MSAMLESLLRQDTRTGATFVLSSGCFKPRLPGPQGVPIYPPLAGSRTAGKLGSIVLRGPSMPRAQHQASCTAFWLCREVRFSDKDCALDSLSF